MNKVGMIMLLSCSFLAQALSKRDMVDRGHNRQPRSLISFSPLSLSALKNLKIPQIRINGNNHDEVVDITTYHRPCFPTLLGIPP
jgi:hypothetical protein